MLVSLLSALRSGGPVGLELGIHFLVLVFVTGICLPIHESAHAWAADRLGDATGRLKGRISLNPLAHLDLYGTLLMFLVGFGYAKPVPVNMLKFKNPKRGMAVTALAGPGSNVLIAVVFLFLYGLLTPALYDSAAGEVALEMLGMTASLSMAMVIFNILPIPPLDGSKVVFSLLPEEAYWKLMQYERYGFVVLLVLLYSGVIDGPLMWLLEKGIDLLDPVLRGGFELGKLIF